MNLITSYWDRVDTKLKAMRASLRLMSDSTGLNYGAIKLWRAKQRIPNPEALIKIAGFLNTTVDYLLTGVVLSNNPMEDPEILAVKSNSNIRTVVKCCTQDPDYLKTVLYFTGSVKNNT